MVVFEYNVFVAFEFELDALLQRQLIATLRRLYCYRLIEDCLESFHVDMESPYLAVGAFALAPGLSYCGYLYYIYHFGSCHSASPVN